MVGLPPLLLLATATATPSAAPAAAPHDSLRVNGPRVPYGLQPLRWGAVQPQGWLRQWAVALSRGAGSPKCSAFATLDLEGGSVDGWKDGRPSFGGFWDEDSACAPRLGIARLLPRP